jgi:hypothetical protein
MAYNLWTNGFLDVDRLVRLFNKQQRAHEPMSGLVDGVNQYFYAQYTPILTSGSVGIFTSGSVPLASTEYILDYGAGLAILTTAPVVQPSITYQTARYSDYVMKSLLIAGFDEMELTLHRGFCLSETLGTLTLVTEDSPTAYITDGSGNPPAGAGGDFDTSRSQIGFYAKCVQLAYLKSLIPESALNGYLWAESGGLRVDKASVPKNLIAALTTLEASLEQSKPSVQIDWFGAGVWGGAVLPPYTEDFVAHRWWQKDSIAKNTRETTAYVGSRW